MKKQTLLYSIIWIVLSSHGQKQFTHTATKANNYCNANCTTLDNPDLNNNPTAIIWATPIPDDGLNLNPHPIGVYYFQNQWRIFNLDQRAMPVGAKFNVGYVTKPDASRFQYVITTENLQKDGSAFIDHPYLNDHPDAKLSFFPSWVPDERMIANRDEINMQYNADAGKWSISNVNKKPLYAKVTYNIVISSAGNTNTIRLIPNPIITNSTIINSTANFVSNGVMAMYVTAWAKGIQVPGGSKNNSFQGKTQIIDYSMAANNLYDAASGMQSGKKVFEPITIKIETGFPPTIPLFNAFANGQPMVFIIDFFAINKSTGAEELNYSIKLTDAFIASFRQTGKDESIVKNKYADEIKIVFGQIEYIKDGKSVLGKSNSQE